MNKEEILRKMKSNTPIESEEFDKELNKQSRDASYCIKGRNLILEDKNMKEMDPYAVCKIYSCHIKNIDFTDLNLDIKNSSDQRSLEGNIFENCDFIECSRISSMYGCLFINCNFNSCDFKETNFVNCIFENTSAENTDFRMANFSLSNYQDIILLNECEIENTLLIENISEKNSDSETDAANKKNLEISFSLMETAIKLISESFRLNEDIQMRFDPMILDISKYIREERQRLEEQGITNLEPSEIRDRLEVHESWADQLLKQETEMPAIDWKRCSYSCYNFKERNLSGIDFTGSNLSFCDFTGANLTGVNFSHCNMTGCILYDVILGQNDFTDTVLEKIMVDKKNEALFQRAGVKINTNQSELQNPVEGMKYI